MIEKGKVFFNKTILYLFPILKCYGEDLIYYLRKFKINGCFLGDENLKKFNSSLFVVFEIEPESIEVIPEYKKDFNAFLKWIRNQIYYLYDYPYIKDKVQYHIIVFDIDNKFNKSFIKFLLDKYSEMYNEEDIKFIFEDDGGLVFRNKKEKTLKVLKFDNKNREKEELENKINIKEEILNYK